MAQICWQTDTRNRTMPCHLIRATPGQLARGSDSLAQDISPFLSQRDDLMRSQQTAAADLERARTAIKMFDGLERRAVTVARLDASLRALRAELEASTAAAIGLR